MLIDQTGGIHPTSDDTINDFWTRHIEICPECLERFGVPNLRFESRSELAAAIKRSPRVTNKPTGIQMNKELHQYLAALNDQYLPAVKDEKEMCETMCNCTDSEAPFAEDAIKYPTPRSSGKVSSGKVQGRMNSNRLDQMDERRQDDLDAIHSRISTVEGAQANYNAEIAQRLDRIEAALGL